MSMIFGGDTCFMSVRLLKDDEVSIIYAATGSLSME